MSGFESIDILTLGDLKLVKSQVFTEITDVSGLGASYQAGKFDGILGMAFPILSVNHVPSVLENLINEGVISNPIFAFYHGNENTDVGELVLGGYDSDRFIGKLSYVSLKRAAYWEIEVAGFNVGNIKFLTSGSSAILVRFFLTNFTIF